MAEKLKKPRLTWRKQRSETGLASIGEGPRGYDLRCQGETQGGAYPKTNWPDKFTIVGYYCYGSWDAWGVPHINTATRPVATMEEAKQVLMDHFQKHIAARLKEANG